MHKIILEYITNWILEQWFEGYGNFLILEKNIACLLYFQSIKTNGFNKCYVENHKLLTWSSFCVGWFYPRVQTKRHNVFLPTGDNSKRHINMKEIRLILKRWQALFPKFLLAICNWGSSACNTKVYRCANQTVNDKVYPSRVIVFSYSFTTASTLSICYNT